MRALIQRVKEARVQVDDRTAGEIGQGLVVFLGVRVGDSAANASLLAQKVCRLRVFDDESGKMNRSVMDIEGEMLIVSQFTLYAETTKGNRPSYSLAAPAEIAEPLYRDFVSFCTELGLRVATSVFRADMQVLLLNDGPVTLLCSTDKGKLE